MVRCMSSQAAVAMLLVFPFVEAQAEIRSVRLVTNTEVHVKPCMPVFGVLEVEFDKVSEGNHKSRIANALSERVILNDEEYGTMGLGHNAVAAFEWIPASRGNTDTETDSGRVFVILFLNFPDKDFLFLNPGIYDFQFFGDVRLRVIVDEPSDDEHLILEKIRDLGMPMALFIMNPSDPHPHVSLEDVEEVIQLAPGSTYAHILKLCLGINKLVLSHYWHEKIGRIGLDAMREERLRFAEEYLGSCAGRPIESSVDAVASYTLGRELLQLAEYRDRSPGGRTGAELRQRGVILLERAADSPFASNYRDQIKQQLEAIRRD